MISLNFSSNTPPVTNGRSTRDQTTRETLRSNCSGMPWVNSIRSLLNHIPHALFIREFASASYRASMTVKNLKWALMLPIAFAVFCAIWIKRTIVPAKSEKQRREEERAHQSRIRRQLRGLPPEHDPVAVQAGHE